MFKTDKKDVSLLDQNQYLQQSEEQGHVFGVLDECVCELGAEVICLLLGVLICEGKIEK